MSGLLESIKTNNELESKGEEGNSCDLVDGEWKCE